jgi:4-hydroxybenzoate polyprenyltransferase
MGAIAMKQYDLPFLFILFLIGFLGHAYGFILNDILDYKIDKSSREISIRPLVSGTISIKKAWILAFTTLIAAFILSLYLAYVTQSYTPLIILAISAFFVTLYDVTSKKFSFADFIIALGIFFIILYGAISVVNTIDRITPIAWLVCILGTIQVLYMQIVAGGIKDVENDFKIGAKTFAIKLGVRVINGNLETSLAFKILTYTIQITNTVLIFIPLFIIKDFNDSSILRYFQLIILSIIAVSMFIPTYKILTMKHFKRSRAIQFIAIYYIFNFTLVPIMLMSLNQWTGLLIFVPPLGFILSNVVLHGTILQPKTM